MKKILFLSILMILVIASYGQSKKNSFSINYFGRNFFHPGIKFGTDILLITTKVDSLKIRKKTHRIVMQNNVGYYYHRNNQHAFFLNTEIVYRIITTRGFKFELFIGVGFQRAFLDGRVYKVNDNLQVKQVYFGGNNYFMPSYAIGFGKYVSDKNKRIKSYSLKIGAFYQYPFNTKFLINPFCEGGVTLCLLKNKTK